MKSSKIALFASLILLTGCASMEEFKPSTNPIISIRSNWNEQVAQSFIDGTYKNRYNELMSKMGSEEEAKNERNRQIYLMINGIDSYYDREIKGKLITGKAAMNTSYDILLLALTGTASFAGGETPQVLSAVATAIQGTKASIDKNFFQNNSEIMLVIKMDQLRAEVYTDIQQSIKQSCQDYPLEAAMRDVIRYYSAGTMKSAIIAIVNEAGTKLQQAEEKSKELLKSNTDMATQKEQLKLQKDQLEIQIKRKELNL
ncbi:MAG: hypothetical protein PHI47_05375 [Sulfuricurvum sp.]|uniref:hypothetical protein n=1 Tax=Sulfuricurvum sp. TaxID=2025608 RepID=UPI002610050E|nr:hypothetical protein [Sulfuricurvum sp.]MDD5159459.1 hypothetical protein [Sulfuricurvum sp.]